MNVSPAPIIEHGQSNGLSRKKSCYQASSEERAVLACVRINYEAFIHHAHAAAIAAIDTGMALLELRRRFPPRAGWLDFVAEELSCSPRTIQRLMAVGKTLAPHRDALNGASANVTVTILYKLVEQNSEAFRAEFLDRLIAGEVISVDEVSREQRLASMPSALAAKVRGGEIAINDAVGMAAKLSLLPPHVGNAIIQHGVTNTQLYEPLAEIAEQSPEEFQEIAASGAIYNTPSGQVSLRHASVSDLKIAQRETAVEDFLSWLAKQEDHVQRRHARHLRSFTGRRGGDFLDHVSSLPELPETSRYVVAIYQIEKKASVD